ncbi:MAG: pilus assembly protein TadA [Elusimicrobia bacterium HGW-Elusimicrobia-2]|nr:MAG: pilus assembly protein TadA [Elusimicrobia bacterium HGW-Elusimicrobia-2]
MAQGRVITIVGAKGGVGQTTFACNIALALHNLGKKTVLLDFNTGLLGELALLLQMHTDKTLIQILPVLNQLSADMMQGFVSKHTSGMDFLCCASEKKETGEIRPSHISKILESFHNTYDFVVVNLGRGFTDVQIAAYDSSDLVFLLFTPELLSLFHAKKIISGFIENHFPPQMVKPVLNKSGLKSGLAEAQIKDYLKQDIFWDLPFDAETLFESINKGLPAVLNAPKSFFSRKIIQLAQNLSFAEDEVEKGRGIFAGLREILSNARRDYSRAEVAPDDIRPVNPGAENIYERLKENIYRKLVERIKERQIDVAAIKTKHQEEKAKRDIEKEIEAILASEGENLSERVDRIRLSKEIMDRALGLGPIEDLLKDPSITEVMVNGMDRIYVERKGKLSLTNKHFSSHDELMNIIQRIVVPLGRRIDEASPMVDARLADGSRVNVIIPPLSLVGPTITIRKFEKESFTFSNLIHMGAITAEIVEFLRVCVLLRKNIIISGGTGTGKTTILNIISGFIPKTERIVTIEDAAELRLPQDHVISLEARPPNIEGKGAVQIRNLVINSLRMRPDRIVIGECRGGEALDMLQAMNTGHDGSLTTIHSNNPRDCLSRLETLVLMSGMDLPVTAIREQIVAAVNIVVQLSRFSDGSRKVTHICEETGKEQNSIVMSTLFQFTQTGIGEKGKVEGRFSPTGVMPTFINEIKARGIVLDLNIFKEGGSENA